MAVSTRVKVTITAIGVPVLMVGAFGWVTLKRYEQAKMDTPLVKAIKENKVDEVKRLLESGADPNARDKPYKAMSLWEMAKSMLRRTSADRGENYPSALMVTARASKSDEIAKLLLDHGAQVNALGPAHTTALLEASEAGQLDNLKLLVDRGADVHAVNDSKQDGVLAAVKAKHADCAKVLLEHGGTAKAREADSHSALAWAVENEMLTVFEPLLKAGANPDDKDSNDKSALNSAITHGNPELVKAVLDNHANPNLACEREPPLVHAYQQIDSTWSGEDSNIKPVTRREILRLLLAAKADPNTTDSEGVPVLFRAMRDGETQLVQQLFDYGADPNLKEKDQPALLEAVTLRDPKVVRMLLDRGASLAAQDPEGTTALMIAAFNGDEEIVKILLAKGADPSARDHFGKTALDNATESPRIAAVIRSAGKAAKP